MSDPAVTPRLAVGLGVVMAVAAIAVVLQLGLELSLVLASVLGLPVVVVTVAKPHWLLAVLFLASGTGMAGALLGREVLVTSLGGLNADSITLLVVEAGLGLAVLGRIGRVRAVLQHRVRFHFLFLVFAGLSLVWTPDILIGAREWSKLAFSLIVLVIAYITWRNRPRTAMLKAMLWMGFIVVLTGPMALLLGNPGVTYWRPDWLFYSGSWGVSSFQFGSFSALLGIYAMVEYHFTKKKAFLLVSLIFFANTFVTTVLSVILPLFVVAGAYVMLTSRSLMKIFYPVFALLALIVVVTSVGPLTQRTFGSQTTISFATIFMEPERLASFEEIRFTRRERWVAAYTNLFEEQPFVGGGLGSFRSLFSSTSGPILKTSGTAGGTYITLLVEIGLAGIGLYLLAFGTYMLVLWRIYKKSRSSAGQKYALIGFLWLLYYMGSTVAYNGEGYWVISFLVFSLIGIAFATSDRARVETTAPSQPPALR